MVSSNSKSDLHPDNPIRRFDVFAEYTRLERQEMEGVYVAAPALGREALLCLGHPLPEAGQRP